MTRNSAALLCLFSIFIIIVAFIKVTDLTVGMTTILVIILIIFQIRLSPTLLCLFSFMFLYVKLGREGELRGAASDIAAQWLLNIIKGIELFFHMLKLISKITVFVLPMGKWLTIKIFKLFIFHMWKGILNFLVPLARAW